MAHELTIDLFHKLNIITVENCKNIMKIFPYTTQRRLQNLTRLKISECKMVEEIFDIKMPIINLEKNEITSATLLDPLDLYRLPTLKYIWSKEP